MARKYGNQKPRIEYAPSYAYTDGKDASELVKAYGYELDPWQKTIINSWLGRDKSDRFTATSCGLSVPRQNGKNALLEVRELYGLVTMGEKILHTAHEVKTARKAFMRLASFFSNERQYPELANMVEAIRKTNGQESIELHNGGSVEFSSRSNGANRGYTVDSVIFDEAQELTEEQLNALLPTLAAAPSGNRQFIYTGTPPTGETRGDAFRRVRQSAIDETSKRVSWFEWSAERIPPKDVSLDELVALAFEHNPAMGYRLTPDFTRQEAIQMSLDGFARERLGWWSSTSTSKAISEAMWNKTFIEPENAPQNGLKTFGVKFSADGSFVSLAGCRCETDGIPHVELIIHEPLHTGINDVIAFLTEEKRIDDTAGIAIDGKAGFGTLLNALSSEYYREVLMIPSTKGCIDASSMFEQALYDEQVTHTNGENGEQNELTNSALTAIKRPMGRTTDGGWIYGGEDSTPIEAVALALWANKTTKIDPTRKAIVW
jgi:hypothetical protein